MNANELADELEKVVDVRHYASEVLRKEVITMLRQQQAEIETLKEVNTKQVDYIAEQKSAYEKLWKEHMELFWKHEKDVDEEQEK